MTRHTKNPLAWLAAVLIVARERREMRRLYRRLAAERDQHRRQYERVRQQWEQER